jgi:hypothetical protein
LYEVLRDEVWMKIKINQMAAQLLAQGLGLMSNAAVGIWMDRLMAAQMECDEEEYRALHHKQG